MTEVATPHFLQRFHRGRHRTIRARTARPRPRAAPGHLPRRRARSTEWAIPANLQPGSMISVELMTGDMSVGADGTLTAIDGKNVYAFGHRFLAVGATDIPFTRSK